MQKAILYLAFLVPLFLQGGWQEARLAGILLLFAAFLLSENKRAVVLEIKRPMNISLLVLGVCLILSLLWTPAPLSIAVAIAITPLYLVLWNMLLAEIPKREGVMLLLTGVGVVALLSIGATFFELRPWAIQLGGSWRSAGTVEYPLALVAIISAAIPWALLQLGKAERKYLPLALIALLLLALLLTGERLALLALIILLVSLIVWPRIFHLQRKDVLLTVGTLFILLAPAAIILQPEWNSEAVSSLLSGRESSWARALQLISERPWGWGAGSWDIVSGEKILFPHSLPLQSGFEAGVWAGAAALFFAALWIRATAQHYQFFLIPLVIGSALLLFDWAWLLPAAGATFLLSTNLAAGTKKE